MTQPEAAPQFDPLMVAAVSGTTVAVWQVETDPAITRGDFSGAWLVTEAGIQGFAATADWIEDRDDQAKILASLLHYPVVLVEGTTWETLDELVQGGVEKKAEKADMEAAAQRAIEDARAEFTRLQPGKKQPAWGDVGAIETISGPVPEGHDEHATEAITAAMETARGLRQWVREFNAFDKVRVRRLGTVDSSHSEARPAPLT